MKTRWRLIPPPPDTGDTLYWWIETTIHCCADHPRRYLANKTRFWTQPLNDLP